jgi:autotransporter-associated beta strand protein
MLGNLSGAAGKTLTITQPDLTTTNRYRVYGTSTTLDSDLVLNGAPTSYAVDGTLFAPYNPTGSQIYNGVISGNGGIIQRAAGITILNGQNTYTGGTIPTTGTIGFGANSTPTVGTVTSGPIGKGALLIAPELPGTTGSGTVLAFGGARSIANPLQYPSGTNNQTLIVGGTNAFTFTGPYTLNGNDSLGGPTNRIFQVTNTALTMLSGVVSDGGAGFGLIKTGNGVLALNNTETYTGPTTVSNGTLQVNGQLAAGAVTVATNGVLGGTGTIGGPVTVQTGGAIAPGASIGILTINNNLALAGNLAIELNKSGSPASDRIVVGGTLNNTGTGTVTVTNLGLALVQGDTFTLFNKAVSNGGALSVTGANVIWTNKLVIDGTIAVASVVSNARTNISFSVSGNNLTLSWPVDHTGWILQAQTNAAGQGLGTNWAPVPGSTSVNQVVMPINPANGSVFYRLVLP